MNNKVFTGSNKIVYVAGDLHGDYKSLKKILGIYEKSGKDSLLLFLGDYADRGCNGVEIIMELDKLLDKREDIVSLKGNHEMYINGRPTFSPCDLVYEAQNKYISWKKFYHNVFKGFLEKLYIAAIINKVLFVHAGISSRINTVKDLSNHENEINLIWSDPSSESGEHPNIRGAGILFGEDITNQVISSLGLKMIIRSHEPDKAAYGPCVEHGGKIITINSCASYGGNRKPFILKINTRNLNYMPIFF